MSDVRIRLAVVTLLSLAAFTGGLGTLFAAVCWIFFCAKETFSRISWKLFVPVTILAAGFPGLILSLTGEEGGLYAAKIVVILAFAFWLGAAQKPGEFLDLGVWALGRKTGFDLGLAAELSMQFFSGISDDLAHIKHALRIKGQKLSCKTLPPLATGLLFLSLARANHVGAHLARRGYLTGGIYVPVFAPSGTDILILCTAGVCAAAVFLAAIPV
ncbi:MAG: hypothetical protein LBL85_04130 [Methanocalculaceae archaeon]|jgi:energy-coupling factor transport system permease protein|nr:hypothetical protein [Methanocalculaceae archaeon]